MLEPELVEKCKNNDRMAQVRLYEKYCHGMYQVAMRFMGDSFEAEDVVQESFIKAFKRMDQYGGQVSFGAWLKKIVVNGSLDKIKAKGRKNEVPFDETYMKLEDVNDNWQVDSVVDIDMVKDAIITLPENSRYVVHLYLVEGYDHAEISSILGISETASRTRLARGKGRLKEKLNKKRHGVRS